MSRSNVFLVKLQMQQQTCKLSPYPREYPTLHPNHTNFLTCSRHSRRLKFALQIKDKTNKQCLQKKITVPPSTPHKEKWAKKMWSEKKIKIKVVPNCLRLIDNCFRIFWNPPQLCVNSYFRPQQAML